MKAESEALWAGRRREDSFMFVPTCFKFYNRFYSEVFYKIKNMVMLTSVPIKEAKEKIFALKRAFYVLIKS
jgi:hypothetical protein